MPVPIEDRLIQLLIERDFKPKIHRNYPDTDNWLISFAHKGITHVITPSTRVADLWWLEDSYLTKKGESNG